MKHAIERLSPQQAQELRENSWLQKEATVHREHIKVLFKQVEEMECRNLEIMDKVYLKRMGRLGLLMKSAALKSNPPTRPSSKKGDRSFSLHPSEVDLTAANFKQIQDPNSNPAAIHDFQGELSDLRIKRTPCTDIMNKVASIIVNGGKINTIKRVPISPTKSNRSETT